MCVIAVTKKGSKIPPLHVLRHMWDSNPNGAGFMYPITTEDGQPALRTVKALMSFSQLKRELQKRREEFMDEKCHAKVDFAIHFRIASVGGTQPLLTHPFPAGESVALMHNGHITSLAYDTTGKYAVGTAPRESKNRQQMLACLKDEDAVSAREYESWVRSVMNRRKITREEAKAIVDKYIRVENGSKYHKKWEEEKDPPESDTSRLAEILGRLPRGWQRNEVCQFLINEAFLGWDRVVIFDHNGLAVILGEKSGDWDNGTWYSNTFWRSKEIVSGKDLGRKGGTSTTVSTRSVVVHSSAKDVDLDDERFIYTVTEPKDEKKHDADLAKIAADMEAAGKSDEEILEALHQADSAGAPSLPPGEASEDTALPDDVDVPMDPKGWEGSAWD